MPMRSGTSENALTPCQPSCEHFAQAVLAGPRMPLAAIELRRWSWRSRPSARCRAGTAPLPRTCRISSSTCRSSSRKSAAPGSISTPLKNANKLVIERDVSALEPGQIRRIAPHARARSGSPRRHFATSCGTTSGGCCRSASIDDHGAGRERPRGPPAARSDDRSCATGERRARADRRAQRIDGRQVPSVLPSSTMTISQSHADAPS